MYLCTALLQQALHELPVGLGDDSGREVRELRLPQAFPEAACLLHVFLLEEPRQVQRLAPPPPQVLSTVLVQQKDMPPSPITTSYK